MFRSGRFLVAGGTGFIGRALIGELLGRGAQVRATHFTRAPLFEHPNLQWLRADLREEADCAAAADGMDYIFNCAAATSGAADIKATPLIHVTPNVVLNARLLEAAYRAKVQRFVFISSAAAYTPRGNHRISEDEMLSADPADVYFAAGWMKRYAEILCRMYAEKISPSMSTLVIRPSNVYGPGDKFDWRRSHVTAALLRRVFERQNPIVVWGTGNDVRDIIYIDDFIAGVMAAFAVEERYFAVNIASGRGYSVADILRTILEVAKYTDAEVRFDPSRPSTVDKLLIDIGLAQKRLGFTAPTSLQEGVARTLAWLHDNPPAESGPPA